MNQKQKFFTSFIFIMLVGIFFGFQNCSQPSNSSTDLLNSYGGNATQIFATTSSTCAPTCSGVCQFHSTDAVYICIYNVGTSPYICQTGVSQGCQPVQPPDWIQGTNSWAKVFSISRGNGFSVPGSYVLTVQSTGAASASTAFNVVQ